MDCGTEVSAPYKNRYTEFYLLCSSKIYFIYPKLVFAGASKTLKY